MSEALGNKVDHVLVSKATRDMANGRATRTSIEAELQEAGIEYQAKLARAREIQLRIEALKGCRTADRASLASEARMNQVARARLIAKIDKLTAMRDAAKRQRVGAARWARWSR